jgi:hypothetical protein
MSTKTNSPFSPPRQKQFPISSHARFAQDAKTQRIQGNHEIPLPILFPPFASLRETSSALSPPRQKIISYQFRLKMQMKMKMRPMKKA